MKLMNALIATALVAGAAISLPAPAEARQGCGPGYHRGPAGRCRPNVHRGRPVLVIGTFYPGRGYWDGRRYWRERYRHHGAWRYR